MKWLVILTVPLLMGAASCEKKKVRSLCQLDVVHRMCWTDKGKGYTFEQIHQMTAGDNPVWCVDTHDLRRIQRKLSQCRAD